MKEPVLVQAPKQINCIQFGVPSPHDIRQAAEVAISQRDLYLLAENRQPVPHGVLDPRLGISNKSDSCATCGQHMSDCVGHWGYIDLCVPVFHFGFFKTTQNILQDICKSCSRVMLTELDRRSFLRRLRAPGIDGLQTRALVKAINERCKKVTYCPHCGETNGVVKKAGPMKIIHDKYRKKSTSDEQEEFRKTMDNAVQVDPQLKPFIARPQSEEMTPLRVYNMFKSISDEDCELMGLNPKSGRPELFLWTSIPVPPVCIRPSVAQDGASNEDDLTVKLSEIIFTNALIEVGMRQGAGTVNIMEQWDYLGLAIAMYINSDVPGAPLALVGKPIRGFTQRLKGKQGRFRGNLSGKRVDFSGRTVISPDPNMRIDEVAVPERVARTLTYPERVTPHNLKRLQKLVANGPDVHPGANYVHLSTNGQKRFLIRAIREQTARNLRVGDIVERHLSDGDVVLFNRQPSLHRLSIMSHSARIMPWRTFRFNECVCTPYNADFDGDEMNLHVPQTEEARIEARELLGVRNNLVTPRNGEPIIGATQDFITTAYLITQKDRFYDRSQFVQIVSYCFDADVHIDIPPPCIVKPRRLWSGKQIINVLIRPNRATKLLLNLETTTKSFRKTPIPDLCPNDGYLIIRNSEIMCGILDKKVVGDGKKESIFFIALRDYGTEEAASLMNRLAKLSARWSCNQGFSIGLSDVMPGAKLRQRKDALIEDAYKECDDYIDQSRKGLLEHHPGCDAAKTLENTVSNVLSAVRTDAGKLCMEELGRFNAPLIMATCGSKGSDLNVCQMVACVGQQIVSNNRIVDGFTDRTLPHFLKKSRTPVAKGFVANSFYSGLYPTEFFFHAASGREGLVDAAVKTAETGYMQRRLVKAFEDLRVHYDSSVRNSAGIMVQFEYGGDSLDPYCLEGTGVPVVFERNWKHVGNTVGQSDDSGQLAPFQIKHVVELALQKPRFVNWTTESWRQQLQEYIDQNVTERLASLRIDYGLESYDTVPAGLGEQQPAAKAKTRGRKPKNKAPENAKPSAEQLSDAIMAWSLAKADAGACRVARNTVNNKLRVTHAVLEKFLDLCIRKYQLSRVDPGTAVGAIGAQSIGEPTTQMTLKAFHFAGIGSMNVTMGVPRIKEIINAAKKISIPVVECKLINETSVSSARIVKGRVERTLLKDIARSISEVYSSSSCYIRISIDMESIQKLQLELTLNDICDAIANAPKLKIGSNVHVERPCSLNVFVSPKDPAQLYYELQHLRRALPGIVVHGIAEARRSVILRKTEDGGERHTLSVEGNCLRDVMNIEGVDGRFTFSNHIMENQKVLGIEAARSIMIRELETIFSGYSISIDIRHLMLLGDLMTCKGELLGITRYGIAKMNDSVMMLASFEKTADHLFDAAVFGKRDMVHGVSERIIMGQQMPVGTGVFKLLMDYDRDVLPTRRPLLFDEPSSSAGKTAVC
ncbi:DNA-directed RNA polymerase III subunit C1 (rpo31) [Coemansia sp. RSA 1813]|nr:DNA-directed RNA polymerase III subunit C1 (rpo31) [Coemansia sp. RSA 1646]KAJ1772223.1 DNA-directed RNA polymerase III subunit C1 (rpo31) [Coemansia sp. RSA 1843]KAJ2091855.1 DNA-directed RNA polymerase III subunit C1 (rpo31) [Coemansia sp. RSA 986]KAJ2215818.1 DNA-directed RNA polymerase III subunit C1 (rpo31) [Coemansia sp. RSA 487]KAJ2571749.1 DNA-directed RNA polymerase III subunit C1 (rpo31) [Coemansia sp. RSA 1813]